MKKGNSILVVAAHPDDEVIGCGGTIAKHIDNGDTVSVLIVAEGETSRQSEADLIKTEEKLSLLHESSIKANKILGTSKLDLLKLPDNRLDSLDRLDLIKIIEKKIELISPNIIYTHHPWDLNIDHRRLHEAVLTASRPYPEQTVKKIFCFEVVSSTEWQSPNLFPSFSPNYYINIKSQIDRKIKSLERYKSEMRDWPHSRSIKNIKNLSQLRGSQVGLEAAEAFILIRQIND